MDGKYDWNLLIRGLKFLAEHSDLSYKEMVEGLKSIGWVYNVQDVNSKISKPKDISDMMDGVIKGDYYTGANILGNVITNPQNYNFVKETLLMVDNPPSIYSFIRIVTKEDGYTMENVLNNSNNKTK